MAGRIMLPNGCSMSKPSVYPPNWENGGVSLIKINWRIQYRFYDPNHPRQVKLCVVKNMNEFKDLNERREITRAIIADQIQENKKGYNPILKKYTELPKEYFSELHPDLPFLIALRLVQKKMSISKSQKQQLKWIINRMDKAAKKLKFGEITISELKRRHLKNIFDYMNMPNNYYNRAKGYLSSLFSELVEYECLETNITRDIRKKKIIQREREILSKDHFEAVMKFLKRDHYNFYRYARIFSYSGSRSSELLRLKAKDVDIENQEYQIIIKKGNQQREQTKVILKVAIPYWKEVLKNANPNDYIFSKNLEPGPEPIRSYQITKRWYRLIKKSKNVIDENGKTIKITADFYSLKHSFLDSLDPETAQKMAAHTNAATTAIYQVTREKRDRERLKELDI